MEDHEESDKLSESGSKTERQDRAGKSRPCWSIQWYEASCSILRSHPPWPFLFCQHFLHLPRLPFSWKVLNHHIWITSKRIGCNTSPWTSSMVLLRLLCSCTLTSLGLNYQASFAWTWNATEKNICLLNAAAVQIVRHCWQWFRFWKERPLGVFDLRHTVLRWKSVLLASQRHFLICPSFTNCFM